MLPFNLCTQLIKYGLVGLISFVVDYGTLYLFTEFVGLHHLVSAVFSFILGLICNYFLSRVWVFGPGKLNDRFLEFLSFAIIGVIGLGFNEIIIYLGTDRLNLHYMLSKIISTVLVFLWNFCARRFLLFES